jgi:hypothetical protein
LLLDVAAEGGVSTVTTKDEMLPAEVRAEFVDAPRPELWPLAEALFDAYNAQGPNPGRTWDGKPVPPFADCGEQVRGKWLAAAREAEDRILAGLPKEPPAPFVQVPLPVATPEKFQEKVRAMQDDLSRVLNRHSAENGSNTPDFILADYLWRCLQAFDVASKAREAWYGVASSPGKGEVSSG